MLLQALWPFELLAALTATERPIRGMCDHVGLQVATLGKSFLANITDMWLLLTVNIHMPF